MSDEQGSWWFRVARSALNVFGISISKGTKHPVHITRRFFYWIGALVVLVLIGMATMYNYSTNPSFCRSCHIMEPYYQAWASSKHKGKASCVDCHYPPSTTLSEHLWHKFQASSQVIKYVTRTYSSKPYAQVEDASCLRSGCHSKRLLEGKTVTPKGVHFDHRPHLSTKRQDRQLSCTSCHSQIVIGTHIEVTYDTCFLCHFKDRGVGRNFQPIGGCLGCHDIPTKDIKVGNTTYNHKSFAVDREVACQNCHIDVVQGDGKAPKERCVDCHNDPNRLEKYGDLAFIHEKHVTENKASCQQCHLAITHNVKTTSLHPDAPAAAECAMCHTDTHTGQRLMYVGVGGRGVADSPSPMYMAQVDCVGCHFDPKSKDSGHVFYGKTYGPTKLGCVQCHGEDYLSIFDMWQAELATALKTVEEKINQAELAMKEKAEKRTEANWQFLDEAKYNYEFVKEARGIHNPDYAQSILRQAVSDLDKILQ